MTKQNIIRNFRQNLRHFERELEVQNNSSSCCGVTLAQCHTLLELDHKDDITLNELCKKLFLDKSTLSRTIEGLVKRGLVSRETPKDNRRVIRIKLTPGGKSVCNRINKGNDDYFKKVLDTLTSKEINQFLESFNKLVIKMIDFNNR
jgi:DNA-binding MarR family transcriptional regulator